MTRQDVVYKETADTHMMEGGGADVVKVTKQCEQTALQLVVPHLQQHTIQHDTDGNMITNNDMTAAIIYHPKSMTPHYR